jgi:hypothetical protein
MNRIFRDFLSFNGTTKTAVSVRDGVLEYMGYEIGMEPVDRVFTVYRSPATIANAANLMFGIPLTDEHVELTEPPRQTVGKVLSTKMIDLLDPTLHSTVGVQNKIDVADTMLGALQSGKRELSLGYRAELVAHDVYDFEQRNIEPHHLAVVDRGRCGAHCSFIDHQGELMKSRKAFHDAEGSPNLEEVVQIAASLPEAIKKLDMESLTKVLPMLQEIVRTAQTAGQTAEVQAQAGETEGETSDEYSEESKDEMTEETKDESTEETKDEQSEEMKDEEKEKVDVTDSAVFKDAVKKAIDSHTAAIVKAKDFVDADYQFVGKSTAQIMRDALATEHGKTKFTDSELTVAFKLLKKSDASLKTFGDSKDPFANLKDKEL